MNFLKKVGWLNLLLVCVPGAIVMKSAGAQEQWLFIVSSIAIIPLAGLMGKSTEMLAHRAGPGIGGLMNASFGNAAELIIAISALRQGLMDVVKASITGSILGNILLVLGASFFAGGLRFERQKFNSQAAGMSATLLALSAVGLLMPAIFHAHLVIHHEAANEQELSLEIATVLFAVYVLLMLFSLKTHRHLYNTEAAHVESNSEEIATPLTDVSHETEEENVWSVKVAVGVLLAATTGVAVMSELLVGAIEETAHQFGWTEIFVGVFVVAIIGNAAEHSTAILAAMKNRMELGFQIAVGSGLQIALFVAPLLVFVSYLPGFPARLDLIFSMMEVVSVAVSVLIVGLVAYDGESNWMEGLLLLAVYVILGISFYHLPVAGH
ncbi:MAG: calcium/proton exchanger [Planctomycetaceae bacterium]